MTILGQIMGWANKAGEYLPMGVSVPTSVVDGARRLWTQAGDVMPEVAIPTNVVDRVVNTIPEVTIPTNVVDYRPSLPSIGKVGEWARSYQDNIPDPWVDDISVAPRVVSRPHFDTSKLSDPSIPWTERDALRQEIEAVYGVPTPVRERRLGYKLAARRKTGATPWLDRASFNAQYNATNRLVDEVNQKPLLKASLYAGQTLSDNPWIVPVGAGAAMGVGGYYLGSRGNGYRPPQSESLSEEEMALMLMQEEQGMV